MSLQASEEQNPTTESDTGQKILDKVLSTWIYIYLYIIFIYIYSYLYLNKDYWKPKCDEHSRQEKKNRNVNRTQRREEASEKHQKQ